MGWKFGQKLIDVIRAKKIKKYTIGNETCIMTPSYIDELCEIGSYTYIGLYNNITKAKIGNYCSIGNYVQIGQGEHNINNISTSCTICEQDLRVGECEIGNDVWIGCQAIIRRGVKVGNGAVIGANSFVNKDVPDFAVVAGCPAKIIKYRFDKHTQEIISNSNWWNYDKVKAKKIVNDITNNQIISPKTLVGVERERERERVILLFPQNKEFLRKVA